MFLFVRTITGKNLLVEVPDNATYGDLKKKIKEKEGWAVEKQKLILCGKLCADERKLKDDNLTKETCLHLVVS